MTVHNRVGLQELRGADKQTLGQQHRFSNLEQANAFVFIQCGVHNLLSSKITESMTIVNFFICERIFWVLLKTSSLIFVPESNRNQVILNKHT